MNILGFLRGGPKTDLISMESTSGALLCFPIYAAKCDDLPYQMLIDLITPIEQEC